MKQLSLIILLSVTLATIVTGCGENTNNNNYSQVGGNNEKAD